MTEASIYVSLSTYTNPATVRKKLQYDFMSALTVAA